MEATQSAPAIQLEHLGKQYGRLTALRDVSLDVRTGEIFGFLGLNGAGKTTTIRILLDLVRPTAGRAAVFGADCQARSLDVRARIGYLPGEPGFYGDMTGDATLNVLGRLGGSPIDPAWRRELVNRLELAASDLRRRIREYSTGMKRKLGIVQAFQADPPLLVLDEPTEGLDPLMQEVFYELVAEMRQRGRTIFMSSHVLPEVERVCDRIGLLRDGELVLLATVQEVRGLAGRRVRVSFHADVAAPSAFPPDCEVIGVQPRLWDLRVRGTMAPVVALLTALPVADLDVQMPHLEEVLRTYYAEPPSPGQPPSLRQPPSPGPTSVPGRGTEVGGGTEVMIRATLVLARHSLTRVRMVAIAMAAVLVGFQFLLTQVAVVLDRNQAFGALATMLPDFMREVAGPSMLAFMSFSGIVALGFFHPIVLASLLGLAIAIATEPAGEVETRFDDLTLTRPVPRAAVIARTVVVMTIVVGTILTLMTVGSWTGLTCCTPATVQRPSIGLLRSLALGLGAIVWCWGGLALAAASAVRRRAVAAGLTGIAALVAYLVDYLGRVWDPLRRVSPLSPFHYFEPMTLITGAPLNVTNLAALFAIGAAGMLAAHVIFGRRDL